MEMFADFLFHGIFTCDLLGQIRLQESFVNGPERIADPLVVVPTALFHKPDEPVDIVHDQILLADRGRSIFFLPGVGADANGVENVKLTRREK